MQCYQVVYLCPRRTERGGSESYLTFPVRSSGNQVIRYIVKKLELSNTQNLAAN